MPIEYAPPMYAVIVNTLQERISDGSYPPDAKLPSETELMEEFGASRTIVVRALDLLRQDGWIYSRQGKGRFSQGKPPEPQRVPQHVSALLAAEVDGRVRVLDAREAAAPTRAAWALGVQEGAPVMVRRWLVSVDEVGPVELGTAYVPLDLAAGTGVGSVEPLREGLARHLADRAGLELDHATQRISARPATVEESRLLEVGKRECMLTALLAVYDRQQRPVLALDVVMPPSRHELEDTFTLR
ncbi:GntR family transcriptional regulator [Dactylosporangium sp. CA-092794]|uniref:GntR family transcriptional regulator n=1 Tax=Dactylosporangium sp. CA-092794 TaxID=3239929 RepID=UPI003D8EA3CA